MFANKTPWVFNEIDIESAKNHIFYPQLRQNRQVDWAAAVRTIPDLNEPFWQKAESLLPPEWHDAAETQRIKSHIESIQTHLTEFTEEIWNRLMA